jgi:ArsR family transcriptional regulator
MTISGKRTMLLQGFKGELFKALGHPARIRMLELLRDGEKSVTELQIALEMEASSVSQQLAVLRARQLVGKRKVGTSVYYRVIDPQVFDLLDTARAMFEHHLANLQAISDEEPILTN